MLASVSSQTPTILKIASTTLQVFTRITERFKGAGLSLPWAGVGAHLKAWGQSERGARARGASRGSACGAPRPQG